MRGTCRPVNCHPPESASHAWARPPCETIRRASLGGGELGSKGAPKNSGVGGRDLEPVPGLKKASSRLEGGDHKAALKALRHARCPEDVDAEAWWRCYRDMARILSERSRGAILVEALQEVAEAESALAGLRQQVTTSQNGHAPKPGAHQRTPDERRAESAAFIASVLASRSEPADSNGGPPDDAGRAWYRWH